jgi:hypothetical protein
MWAFYRQDDYCATAYFYLDKPTHDLPPLPGLDVRVKGNQIARSGGP